MKKAKQFKSLTYGNRDGGVIRISRDQGASLFLLGLGIGIALLSLQYEHGAFSSPGPGFVGFWSGVVIACFSVVGFFTSLRNGMGKRRESVFGPLWVKPFTILLSLVGYAIFLDFLGFLICTFLFMLILLGTIETHHWKAVLIESLGTAIVSYLIFQVLLKTQLPMGILRYLGF